MKTVPRHEQQETLEILKLQLGDGVTVSRDEDTVWMLIEDGRLIGGFTIRVVSAMPVATGRVAVDRQSGASFNT